ncbi:MAG: 3'-5' exonuclease, partial [Bacteroidota bacterium]
MYDLIRTPELIAGLEANSIEGVKRLLTVLDELSGMKERKSALQVVQELVSRSRFNIGELEKSQAADAQVTIGLIAEFLRFVEEKSQIEENKTFLRFMEYLDYYIEGGGTIEPQDLQPLREVNAVQCMTGHAAKGLEFDTVFVVGLTNNRFPTRKRAETVSFPRELFKGVIPEGDLHIQEERRLFYVAMTRAKNELYLSAIEKRRNPKSRFIDEVGSKDSWYLEYQTVEHLDVPVEEAKGAEELLPGPPKRQFTLFPMPERLKLSYSKVETYNTCPLKYKFRYVYQIPSAPKGYMTYGDVQHRVLDDFFSRVKSGEEVSFETLRQLYEKHWRDEGYPDTLQQREYKKRGYEELSEFYERNRDTLQAPLALEENFS